MAETFGFFHSDNLLKRSKVPTLTKQWSSSCGLLKCRFAAYARRIDQDVADERDIFLSFGGRSCGRAGEMIDMHGPDAAFAHLPHINAARGKEILERR